MKLTIAINKKPENKDFLSITSKGRNKLIIEAIIEIIIIALK